MAWSESGNTKQQNQVSVCPKSGLGHQLHQFSRDVRLSGSSVVDQVPFSPVLEDGDCGGDGGPDPAIDSLTSFLSQEGFLY